MKNICLLIFPFLVGMNLMAQSIDISVFGSAGGTFQEPKLQLQWTLGESNIAFFSAKNGMITEGFNQPLLPLGDPVILASKDIALSNSQLVQVNAFPNPFSDRLILQLAQEAETALRVTICNLSGEELFSDILPANQQQIELYYYSLPAGWYVIKLVDRDTAILKAIIKVAKVSD